MTGFTAGGAGDSPDPHRRSHSRHDDRRSAYSRDGRLIGIPTIAPTQASAGRPPHSARHQPRRARTAATVACRSAGLSARSAQRTSRAGWCAPRRSASACRTTPAPSRRRPKPSRASAACSSPRVNVRAFRERGRQRARRDHQPLPVLRLSEHGQRHDHELRVTVDDVTEAIYGLPPATGARPADVVHRQLEHPGRTASISSAHEGREASRSIDRRRPHVRQVSRTSSSACWTATLAGWSAPATCCPKARRSRRGSTIAT